MDGQLFDANFNYPLLAEVFLKFAEFLQLRSPQIFLRLGLEQLHSLQDICKVLRLPGTKEGLREEKSEWSAYLK